MAALVVTDLASWRWKPRVGLDGSGNASFNPGASLPSVHGLSVKKQLGIEYASAHPQWEGVCSPGTGCIKGPEKVSAAGFPS